MDPVLTESNQKKLNALDHLKKELATIRAGRANPTLIEDIPVLVYGTRMKIAEVGTISAPQPTLLTINVWDQSITKEVQDAILEANIGLNPSIDGQTIRIPIPPLSEERRGEFVKVAHQKGEEAKVEVRQIRQVQRETWEKAKSTGEIGENELFRRQDILQKLIDRSMDEVDQLVRAKEEELRQV